VWGAGDTRSLGGAGGGIGGGFNRGNRSLWRKEWNKDPPGDDTGKSKRFSLAKGKLGPIRRKGSDNWGGLPKEVLPLPDPGVCRCRVAVSSRQKAELQTSGEGREGRNLAGPAINQNKGKNFEIEIRSGVIGTDGTFVSLSSWGKHSPQDK